jgi:hypothetical protein
VRKNEVTTTERREKELKAHWNSVRREIRRMFKKHDKLWDEIDREYGDNMTEDMREILGK